MRHLIYSRWQTAIFIFLVLVGSLPIAGTLALAKDHIGKSHGHERDFYAISEEPTETPHATAARSNCFMSSSSAEAARGIRHWNGSC